MEKQLKDKLQELMDKREKRGKNAGGEIYAFWGMLMILNILIQMKWTGMPWITLVLVIAGVTAQIAYVRVLVRRAGYQLIWNKIVGSLWLYIAGLNSIVLGVFCYAAGIISPRAGYALIYLILAIGMFLSGMFLNKWSYRIGGAALLAASMGIALPFIGEFYLIMIAGLFFGFVLPGVFCRIMEKPA